MTAEFTRGVSIILEGVVILARSPCSTYYARKPFGALHICDLCNKMNVWDEMTLATFWFVQSHPSPPNQSVPCMTAA